MHWGCLRWPVIIMLVFVFFAFCLFLLLWRELALRSRNFVLCWWFLFAACLSRRWNHSRMLSLCYAYKLKMCRLRRKCCPRVRERERWAASRCPRPVPISNWAAFLTASARESVSHRYRGGQQHSHSLRLFPFFTCVCVCEYEWVLLCCSSMCAACALATLATVRGQREREQELRPDWISAQPTQSSVSQCRPVWTGSCTFAARKVPTKT